MIRNLLIIFFIPFSLFAQRSSQSSYQDLFPIKPPADLKNNDPVKSTIACYRIPALATTPDGTLLAAIDERVPSCKDLGQNDDINIVLRKSFNNGKDWTATERLIDFPKGISASDASFITDRDAGIVFLFYNYMDLRNEKGRYRFKYIQSNDNGRSWSAPVDITDQISLPGWSESFVFITSGNGIQTKSGMLLHTLVHVGEKSGYVFGSSDHGKTWVLFKSAFSPADESRIVELADGRWMVNARVNGLGKRMIHLSSDQGSSWVSAEDPGLKDPGCNAALLNMPSGKKSQNSSELYFINPASATERMDLTLKKSTDHGKTWKVIRAVYEASSAYAAATIMRNGKIGIFFERDDYRRNSFVIINE